MGMPALVIGMSRWGLWPRSVEAEIAPIELLVMEPA